MGRGHSLIKKLYLNLYDYQASVKYGKKFYSGITVKPSASININRVILH